MHGDRHSERTTIEQLVARRKKGMRERDLRWPEMHARAARASHSVQDAADRAISDDVNAKRPVAFCAQREDTIELCFCVADRRCRSGFEPGIRELSVEN